MWRNYNHTLLEEMQNGVATLEDSVAVPQNVKQSYHMIQQFHSQIHIQENCKHKCPHKMYKEFIAAPFIMAQKWKQLRCPSTGEWINKM